MSTIHITTGDGQTAQHDEDLVKTMLEQGLLRVDTLYWKEGMSNWQPLSSIFGHTSPTTPPPPPLKPMKPLTPPAPAPDGPQCKGARDWLPGATNLARLVTEKCDSEQRCKESMKQVKFNCLRCKCRLKTDSEACGETINCPKCGTAVVVPFPGLARLPYGAVIRDVLIVWLLTSIGGFIVGIGAGSMLALMASNLLLGTVAFTIVGCLARECRWKHLAIVALFSWLTSIVNIAFGCTLIQWFFGFIPVALIMGLGGGISHLIRRGEQPQ